MDNEISINPCPFCGKSNTSVGYKRRNLYYGIRVFCSIRCNSCHAHGSVIGGVISAGREKRDGYYYTTEQELKDKAITSWNMRK